MNLLRSFKSSNVIQQIEEGGVGGCKFHLFSLREDLTKSVLPEYLSENKHENNFSKNKVTDNSTVNSKSKDLGKDKM